MLKQVLHRPIGRTLGDIFADFGIGPALCQAKFWTDLFIADTKYNDSPAIYDVRRWRREQHFEEEQDEFPTMDLSWPPLEVGGGRSGILQAFGFLIGEPPVEPRALLKPELAPPPRPAAVAPAAQHPRHPLPSLLRSPAATRPP